MKIDLNDFSSDKASVKYCCAKNAINLSKKEPRVLYPDLDFFVKMLKSEKNVIKWTACQVIGNLAKIDNKHKAVKVIPQLKAFLKDKMMITAANAIYALAEIAYHKPKYRTDILKNLLSVEKNIYYSKGKISPECTNVAIQHVLLSLEKFGPEVYQKKEVISFLRRQTKNSRSKVQVIANSLLKNET